MNINGTLKGLKVRRYLRPRLRQLHRGHRFLSQSTVLFVIRSRRSSAAVPIAVHPLTELFSLYWLVGDIQNWYEDGVIGETSLVSASLFPWVSMVYVDRSEGY